MLAPLIKDRKGHHQQVFEDVRKAGFVRVRVDGYVRDVDEEFELDRYKNHTIEAVVDRLVIKTRRRRRGRRSRAIERLDRDGAQAGQWQRHRQQAGRKRRGAGEDLLFSEHFACPFCDISLPEIEPRTFSLQQPARRVPGVPGPGRQDGA